MVNALVHFRISSLIMHYIKLGFQIQNYISFENMGLGIKL